MNTILQKRIEEKSKELAQKYFPNEMNIWARQNLEAQYVESACKEIAAFILQSQWISVEEALPESIVQRVLVVNHHFPFDVYFGRYQYGKWIIEGESEDLWITHWMPIPELKGSEE